MLTEFKQDVRFSIRSLSRSPGLSLGILATLALGIGANAVMFSFLDTIFVRAPSGIVRPAELRRVWYEFAARDGTIFWPGFSFPQYAAVVDAVRDRAQTAIYSAPTTMRLGRGTVGAEARVSYASASYFPLLGVRAEVGRLYGVDEDRLGEPTPVVVASRMFFDRVLRGDRSAVGKPLVIAGITYALIGVTPAGFTGADLDAADLWLPIATHPTYGQAQWWTKQDVNAFAVLLRPSAVAGDRELEQRITSSLRRPDVRMAPSDSFTVARFGPINLARGPGKTEPEVQIGIRLAGVAFMVLLITCANVVNLLLARAIRRRREIALRLALGGSGLRLIRLLLVESGLLGIGAGGIAIAVAFFGGGLLRSVLLPEVRWSSAPVDWRVAFFAICAALGAGTVAGLVPAWQTLSPDLTSSLKSGRGSGVVQRSALRSSLVGAQAALSVVLLVGAVLFLRSLSNVRGLDIGFAPATLVTARVEFDGPERGRDPTLTQRLTDLVPRIGQLPGVERVALSSIKPMAGFSVIRYYTGTDSTRSRRNWAPTVVAVTPGFFAATGIQLLRGRDFSAAVDAQAPVVVVNERMASAVWPGRDAIGQCLHLGRPGSPCYQVIGVAENSRRGRVIEETEPQFYIPFTAIPPEGAFLRPNVIDIKVRPGLAAEVSRGVSAVISRGFPGSIPSVHRMSDDLEPQYRPWQLGAALFTGFGVLALLVAAIGIYSTVSFTVAQRTHEFGVRIALGAQFSDVVAQVLGQGLRSVVAGIVLGVVLTLAGGRLIASLLFGVAPYDPLTIAAVTTALLAVAATAALAPAWRASRVDPMTALRVD